LKLFFLKIGAKLLKLFRKEETSLNRVKLQANSAAQQIENKYPNS